MISSRKQSCSFVTLQINSRRHDYLPGISVLMHAMKELNVARRDRQAMGKRSFLVTPLGGAKILTRGTCSPGNSTGKKLSPKVKEIEPSGFQQNVRLEILKLAPQEQNLGQPRF